jgi:phosphotransferase system HPr-like phosphotransfer protein
MMLAAEEGSTIRVRAAGPDEVEAVAALRDLVDGRFGGEP